MDCPSSYMIESGGFRQRLKEHMASQRIPLSGSLEVTFRCNLRCTHCYLGDSRSGLPSLQELSLAEIQRILDEISDAGCLNFLITGGEPFLRPDLLDIYDYAKKKGLLVILFTNGTLLTKKIADHLADWRPYGTEITLYGATQATYERVTGIPGSYARAMRGIDLLVERGIPLKLKTMLMTLNRHELAAMQQIAADRGLEFRYDPLLNGGFGENVNVLPYRLAPEEVVKTEIADPIRGRSLDDFYQRLAGKLVDTSRIYTCGAGINSFHIDPYGKMSSCIASRARSYDLRSGTFQTGWEQFMPQERALPATRVTRCSRCELRSVCEQCVGLAHLESGDEEEPVEYLCQLTHLRVQAFKVF